MNTKITINPKFKSLIPPLSPEELSQLEANIKADGCRDPLVLWRETIVDGHNRYDICTRLNIPFNTHSIKLPEGADEDAVCIWIIDNQKGRRNVRDIDRIGLALKRSEFVARKAKENQRQSEGRGKKGSAKLPNLSPVNTRAELAKHADVGDRTFDAGKLILEAAEKGIITQDVVEDVRSGKSAIHRVAKDIKEKLQRDGRAKKRVQQTVAIHTRIIVGDFREHAGNVADGSVSLIFTDPPYDREASKMLPALAEFAEAKLADGGSLICYVGQTQLPTALDALRTKLRYWWTIACIHSGRATVMREYGINAGWKGVLWFVKGTRDNNSVMVSDVMSGGEEKSHHDWQQSQSEAEYWIDKLCPSDGIVCDPFLGGGTTAAAAKKLGREWVAFEVSKESARIASARLQ